MQCNYCVPTCILCFPFSFRDENFQHRNPSSHNRQCSLLNGPLSAADSTTYGINGRSVLNDIPYFHVAKPMLPQDIMHLLFEGVIPWEVKLMLTKFIKEKHYFKLDQLNERIRNFAYGRSESRNKPHTFEPHHIFESSKLPVSGEYDYTIVMYIIMVVNLPTRGRGVI